MHHKICTVLFGVIWGLVLVGCGDSTSAPKPVTKADFPKLVGRWLRPDGDYLLELRSVADDGKIEALYFNPNPIKVSKAQATADAGTLKVFIELRDVNYPGCTYTLTYDPQEDQLKGVYYQAAMQQQYEIIFNRMR